MLFRPPKNPKVEELTKNYKERSVDLSRLTIIPDANGKRFCVWCSEKQLRHGNQKYCSKECSNSAFAWAYPQKETALFFLLARQSWKCNACSYSWEELAKNMHNKVYRGYEKFGPIPEFGKQYEYRVVKYLKNNCPNDRKVQIDHIIPIYKGGTSLGLDNHQAICYKCHKDKTKKDLSGKRQKKVQKNEI